MEPIAPIKPVIEHVERDSNDLGDGDSRITENRPSYSAADEAQLVRRLDMTLMPTLWFMYLFSYADRTNIGNAKIAGMMDDLDLSSDQYSLALVVFFISYIFFQVPSNYILSYTKPSMYLPAIMILWGALTCCMAAVKSYGALLAVRFVLGILEAGFAPGVSLVLSAWYKRAEQAKRFSVFYSAAVLSGAFGGIIAGAITGSLHDAHGIVGWRWLFIVEGVATMGCALISAFLLPDFPANSKRFPEKLRLVAIQRLVEEHVATETEGGGLKHFLAASKRSLSNWRTWILAVGYTAIGGSGSMSYFYPTLVAELGYTSHMAQYMVVPIYSVAFVSVLATGYFCDRFPKNRGLVIAGWLGCAMICAIIVCAVYNATARYVLLVFMASGLLAANALSLAYAASSLGGMDQDVRAISLAFVNSLANFAQIYGAYLFPSKDSPKYIMGFAVIASLSSVGVLIYIAAHILIRKYPIK